MRRQQVAKPKPLFEEDLPVSRCASAGWWLAGQDLPIGASHKDGEGLLVSNAAEWSGGCVHVVLFSLGLRELG
jgi:hypothetical protein